MIDDCVLVQMQFIHSQISHDLDLSKPCWKPWINQWSHLYFNAVDVKNSRNPNTQYWTNLFISINRSKWSRIFVISGFSVFFAERRASCPSIFLVKCRETDASFLNWTVEPCRCSKRFRLTSQRPRFEIFQILEHAVSRSRWQHRYVHQRLEFLALHLDVSGRSPSAFGSRNDFSFQNLFQTAFHTIFWLLRGYRADSLNEQFCTSNQCWNILHENGVSR